MPRETNKSEEEQVIRKIISFALGVESLLTQITVGVGHSEEFNPSIIVSSVVMRPMPS
jgi:hypothetical protein